MMNIRTRNTFLATALLFGAALSLVFAGKASASAEEHANHVRSHADLEIYDFEAPDACDPKANQVRITVTGLTGGGILTVELYNDPDHFLSKAGRVRRVRVPAGVGEQIVCMNSNVLGRFAAAAYHDVDGNRKLKKNMFKLPREPIGLSNNPKVKALKFPKFSDSSFELVMGGTNITLELVDLKKQKKAEKTARKRERAANKE
ncbi:MAG: DUF2141 domain-containing protein [Robiginitomaculum sp.]|nr:DUF2141 domain-containing protein [Robiginitomaculum sp.]